MKTFKQRVVTKKCSMEFFKVRKPFDFAGGKSKKTLAAKK